MHTVEPTIFRSAENCKHQQSWTRYGAHFSVRVTRIVEPNPPANHGKYMWFVYLRLDDAHKYFAEFTDEKVPGLERYTVTNVARAHQKATQDMPFRGGCSYLKFSPRCGWHLGTMTVGTCYYEPEFEEIYSHMRKSKDAAIVFADAEELYNWIKERS